MLAGEVDEQPNSPQADPAWKPTDWTPRQRAAAIWALLLLTLASALISGALFVWGSDTLAMGVVVPIGVSLLCLGTPLLSYVYWYAYAHASNRFRPRNDETGSFMIGALVLAGVVAALGLLWHLVGLILAAPAGLTGLHDVQTNSLMTCVVVLGVNLLAVGAPTLIIPTLPLRPTRDPAAPECALSAPVTGARFTLRWLVMLLTQASWLLILPPLWTYVSLESQMLGILGGPETRAATQTPAAVAALAGVFFLVAALAELTHSPHPSSAM